jgi:hypothetical protein
MSAVLLAQRSTGVPALDSGGPALGSTAGGDRPSVRGADEAGVVTIWFSSNQSERDLRPTSGDEMLQQGPGVCW